MVSTPLKIISQIGSFPQIGVKTKKIFETTTQKLTMLSQISKTAVFFFRKRFCFHHILAVEEVISGLKGQWQQTAVPPGYEKSQRGA